MRQGLGIHPVGFGEASAGFGKVAGRARIDDRDRQACRRQGGGEQSFQPARRFQHNAGGRELAQLGDERGKLCRVMGSVQHCPVGRTAKSSVRLATSIPTKT